MGRLVERLDRDRRLARRHTLKTALQVRFRSAGVTEQKVESENLSQRGVFFVTNLPFSTGTELDLLVEMPERITGASAAQWLCAGHVVRVVPLDSPQGTNGVGVQFDFHDVMAVKAATAG
jgi:Tfp pilus assembly protein PilZ